jgi:signal transduction histidine kinase
LLVKATGADHATCVLRDTATGELMPIIASSTFSRGIVEHVLREERGILVSDAATDDRFARQESVVRQNLRDVIAVPLRGRHAALGVLLLDARTPGTFQESHLHLAVALARQAALAVEEARHFAALANAQRLAAVGQTISAMSHHIKNVMQGVQFGGDLIRSGLADNNRNLLEKGWRLVEDNQSRIDGLIRDMLSYSTPREPLREPTDLVAMVNEVVESLQGRAARHSIELRLQSTDDPHLWAFNCDGEGIRHAVLNVVSNALDAVERAEVRSVHVEFDWQNDAAVIAVTDNGPGVPTAMREAIFEPFVSGKGARGTGLGLPVSRKIAREHGGDLIVEDAPTGGARFVLKLPETTPM